MVCYRIRRSDKQGAINTCTLSKAGGLTVICTASKALSQDPVREGRFRLVIHRLAVRVASSSDVHRKYLGETSGAVV